MKRGNRLYYEIGTFAVMMMSILVLMRPMPAAGQNQPVGPGTTLVQSKFGGQIFGFDIDQNGTEGVLSESQLLSNGNVLAAVETFDQKTGKILKVVSKMETQDDFLTLGIAGDRKSVV